MARNNPLKDSLRHRLKLWYWTNVHCPIFGHKEQRKMRCVICGRCRKILYWTS